MANNVKQVTVVAVTVCLCFSLAGCGKKTSAPTVSPSATPSGTTVTTETTSPPQDGIEFPAPSAEEIRGLYRDLYTTQNEDRCGLPEETHREHLKSYATTDFVDDMLEGVEYEKYAILACEREPLGGEFVWEEMMPPVLGHVKDETRRSAYIFDIGRYVSDSGFKSNGMSEIYDQHTVDVVLTEAGWRISKVYDLPPAGDPPPS